MQRSGPSWCGSCPLCRGPISIYTLRDAEGGRLAKPAVTTMFGSIFAQNNKLGCASYHFDSEEDCYISYTNAHVDWCLDDGSPLPAKKPFTNARYDEGTRTFRGQVEWMPPRGGETLWEYEMIFAEDFSAIVGGQTRCSGGRRTGERTTPFGAPWQHHRCETLSYNRWTPPPTNIFGSVYVQGQDYMFHMEGVASYHFNSPDNCFVSYANAPVDWLLDDGSDPPARKPFTEIEYLEESRTFRAAVEWQPAFQGDVRWEYEMVFSEDFNRIVGGTCHRINADGKSGRTIRFGRPTPQTAVDPHIEGLLSYVRKPTAFMDDPRLHYFATA